VNQVEFERTLRQDGFAEIAIKELPAAAQNNSHGHPFDAKALILQGEITLTVDGVATAYPEGTVFYVPAGLPPSGNRPRRWRAVPAREAPCGIVQRGLSAEATAPSNWRECLTADRRIDPAPGRMVDGLDSRARLRPHAPHLSDLPPISTNEATTNRS
jgi:Cupin domain